MLVTVYSLPTEVCVKCRGVEIAMRHRGIKAEKVMLNEDAEAMEYIKSLGYTEAPVTVITQDGEVVDHWSGFRDEKISQLKNMVAA